MSNKGNVQITILFTCGPDHVAAGDALFADHAAWMAESHPRSGELALISYEIVKGAELENPLNPGSDETGNTTFALTEIYASAAGVANHWRMGTTEWSGFGAFVEFAGNCTVVALHGSEIVQSI